MPNVNVIGFASVVPEFAHKVSQAEELHPQKPTGTAAGNALARSAGSEIAAAAYDVHVDCTLELPGQLFSVREFLHKTKH